MGNLVSSSRSIVVSGTVDEVTANTAISTSDSLPTGRGCGDVDANPTLPSDEVNDLDPHDDIP